MLRMWKFKDGDSRFFFLVVGVLVYAGFSTPFPRHPGIPEIVIACMLVLFVGIKRPIKKIASEILLVGENARFPLIYFIAFYFLTVPVIIFLFERSLFTNLIRDYIPLVYMLMPLFFAPVLSGSGMKKIMLFKWLLVFGGVIYTARYFFNIEVLPWQVGDRLFLDSMLYFLYDPLVLFAVTYMLLESVNLFLEGGKKICLAIVFMVVAIFIMSGLVATIQRGSIVLIISVLLILLLSKARTMKGVLLAVVALVALYGISVYFSSAVDLFVAKTEDVGTNNKLAEAVEIMTVIFDGGVFNTLFGVGWGGVYVSPGVGGNPVRFTHSMITYFLLKTGIVGLILFLYYMFYVGKIVLRGVLRNDIIMLASVPPLLYGLLFQPTYKTLGFGLVLSIIYCIDQAARRTKRIDRAGFQYLDSNDMLNNKKSI